ncbi:MAG: WXG100 family type VII secretion target [Holdemanella porci]
MAQIQISSEDVMAYSKQVDTYANEIRTVFNEIESRMYYVESIWQSPASKYFMEQFQTLNPAMMSYLDTLARFFYVFTSNRKSISGKRTIFDAL